MTFEDYCKDLGAGLAADVAAVAVDEGVEISWTDPPGANGREEEGSTYSVYLRATPDDPWREVGTAESAADGVRASYLDAPGPEDIASAEYAVTMEGCGEFVIDADTSAIVARAASTD